MSKSTWAKTPEPVKAPLRPRDDTPVRLYDDIARVHRQIVEARRASMAGQTIVPDPGLMLHCEEAIAFLAKEVLRLESIIDPEEVSGMGPSTESS